MPTVQIIDHETGNTLVNGPLLVVPRRGEWVKLRDIVYSVYRIVHEFIPTAHGSVDLIIRVYVDRV